VTTIFNTKRDKIRQADEFERKATDLRDSMSVVSRGSPAKRKPEMEGESHLHLQDDQDFASMSASRLKEIMMLNCASSKSSKVAAATSLVLRHSLSETDVVILTDFFTQFLDRFLYQL
jgi:hypothetical protein